MGWEFWQANLNKSRRQLVAEHVEWDSGTKSCRVVFAREKGREVYLAVRLYDRATEREDIIGVVAITQIRAKESFNFGVKLMDETMHPVYYHAPRKLLDMLSPTSDPNALEWRRKCYEQCEATRMYEKSRRHLHSLPYGTIIQLNNEKGTMIELFNYKGRLVYKIMGKRSRIRFPVVVNYGYKVISVGKKGALST